MKTHILLSSFFLLISFSVFSQSGTSGLVAYYPFNGNANDESGNAINPTYIGTGVTLTTDRFGNPDKAYNFDGNAGSYIRMPADKLPTTNRTISLWFNVPEVSNRPGLLGYGGNGSCGTSFFMALNCMGGGQYMLQGHCAINQAVYAYTAEPINNWYHWVAVIDGNVQKIYVNGELKSTENTFTSGTAVAGADFALGVISYVNGTVPYTDINVGYLKGKLDDVRIYDKVLSDEQVNELYKIESDNTVAWFPFNGDAVDKSTTANHAAVHGATLTTDRLNNPDQAYSFNGSTDRLQAPENDAYDFGDGDFSITSWVSLNEIKTARIVSAGYTDNDGIWGLGLGSHPKWDTGLRINYFVYSGGDYHDFNSNEITGYTLGRWAMVGITKKGNTLTFYFNGQQAGTATIPFVSNANSYLSIGSRQLTSGSHIEFMNGKIDEVRIYKRGLSEAEMVQEYNSTRNSLVAYYPFNGNANDESGNGHDGTINGNATRTSDRFMAENKAFTFPDQSSNISLANSTNQNLENGFTINAWVKYQNTYSVIVGKHVCGFVNGFIFGIDYDGQIQLALANSGWSTVKSNTTFVENRWYLVTATYNAGSGTAKIYINGELNGSGNVSYTNFSSHPISIGEAFQNNCQPANMTGTIDEVKIYDQPLTDAEILQEYKATKSNLVAYYPFNGNANDESSYGNNGTLMNGPSYIPDRSDNADKAIRFEKSASQYVSVPTSSSLQIDKAISFSFWLKRNSLGGVDQILNKGGDWPYGNCNYGLVFSDWTLCFIYDGGYYIVASPGVPQDSDWHHYAVTAIEGTTEAHFYVDGVEKTSMFGEGNPIINFYSQSTADLHISGVNYFSNNSMDELKIYNRILTANEIKFDYSNLVAYYPFNGNANDESGNGNNGTITGPMVTPAVDRYGQEGKAYKFWFPDYISVPTNSSFFTDEFTVSFWYKVESHWGDRCVLSCVGKNGGYQQPFSGTTFSYMFGYNFTSPGDKWFWTNYTVPNIQNTWQHITTSYKKTGDKASISKLYINGELKSSDTYTNSIAYPGSEIFYLGRNHSDVGLNGELDEVRFYNRALTDAEVMAIYTAETPTAVKNQFSSNVRISPNPTDGHFGIDLGRNYLKIELRITDMTGRMIKKLRYSGQQKLTVDLEGPSGIYFLNILTESENGTYKLIKK